MTRIASEQLVYLAVGVPENGRQRWAVEARTVLERRGFAVLEMSPTDIVEQAEHIKNVYDRSLNEGADNA